MIPYQRRPEGFARKIRESVKFVAGALVGLVVCGSRLSPTRMGTIGVTLAILDEATPIVVIGLKKDLLRRAGYLPHRSSIPMD